MKRIKFKTKRDAERAVLKNKAIIIKPENIVDQSKKAVKVNVLRMLEIKKTFEEDMPYYRSLFPDTIWIPKKCINFKDDSVQDWWLDKNDLNDISEVLKNDEI